MWIEHSEHEKIKNLNVNEHVTVWDVGLWKKTFPSGSYTSHHLEVIENELGTRMRRSDLVAFYGNSDVASETKFIAAMIWGHEAPAGSRRDTRGPWKVSRMFNDSHKAESVIRSVCVGNDDKIIDSYQKLDGALERCGPNFFTKHFYFLGKSNDAERYPLIFDDRVANGLIKLSLKNHSQLEMVRVSALRKPEAYREYLAFARRQADCIGCSLDQIEYYLFNL